MSKSHEVVEGLCSVIKMVEATFELYLIAGDQGEGEEAALRKLMTVMALASIAADTAPGAYRDGEARKAQASEAPAEQADEARAA
jgi:hypothetical protein